MSANAFDNAVYYSCNEDDDSLEDTTPEDAIRRAYNEYMTCPEPVTVTAFTPQVPTDAWTDAMSDSLFNELNEAWREDFCLFDHDGVYTLDVDGSRLLFRSVVRQVVRGVAVHDHVAVGTREYTKREVELIVTKEESDL